MRTLQPGRLVLASHNAGKLREFAGLLLPHGMELVSAASLGLPEPAETGDTFAANAALKARAAARATGLPALADDSGLEVAGLGGQPGVRTADWAMRADGTRDYPAAMARIAAADRTPDHRCAFVAVLVLAWPDGHAETFEGRCEGHWIAPPRGERGFGYDPLFIPDGATQTFGEMAPEEKARHSHRARAFAALAAATLSAG